MPDMANVALTTQVLEVFHVTRLCCPCLAIQPFVKLLWNIHGVAFCLYLSTQFFIAFNLYLATLAIVDKHIQVALCRDAPNWQLKIPSDYYLPVKEVNLWSKAELEKLLKGFTPDPAWNEEEDGCSEQWQNMKEDMTAKVQGMYDEMGLFLLLCHHGFVLLVCDMIESRELAKYGYAVTHHLIKVLSEIALGYDIGCKFSKTVNAHPILGAFHRHGHCRLCQLSNLATYVKGVELDDLEYCETFSSKSNALAASPHMDIFDTYQSLSLLLANKYKCALGLKSMAPVLTVAMRDLGVVEKSVFKDWLTAEKVCPLSLRCEPVKETQAMEHYQKLVNLTAQT
ncbi:hypothetical protein DFH09DRAFT_1314159 [Mycena vulgaris]|nr:hypothetical protein DFH09DRAFT_1314159 [Mycena vulgaris]